MKNKKILRAIAALTLGAAAVSCLTLFGCSHKHKFSEEWKSDETSHWHEATCDHKDEVDAKAPHIYDNDSDVDCNVCGYVRNLTPAATQFTVTFVMNDHGAQIEAVKVDENGKLSKPADPTAEGWTFGGWFTDEECTQAYDFETAVTGNFSLYALWEHNHDFDTTKWMFDGINHFHTCKVDGCNERTDVSAHTFGDDGKCVVCGAEVKDVSYVFEPTRLTAGQHENGITSGIFGVVPGGKVRTRERLDKPVLKHNSDEVVVESFSNTIYDDNGTLLFGGKSVQMDGTNRGFSVNAISPGVLTFYAENGSSAIKEDQYQKVILTKPDGTTEELSYLGKGIRAVTVNLDQVGLYTITRGATNSTTDVYYAKFDTTVPVTAVEKIEISNKGKVEYIVGQDLDLSMLQVQIVREITGMIEPVLMSDLTIDFSAYDKTRGGTYTIVVKYKDENEKEFRASYDVTVYEVEALQLGFNAIIQGGNTSAGNGTYVNHAVQQFYFKGQELDLDGLTVRTVFNGGKQTFIVTEGFTVSGYDKNTAGMQTIKVTWTENPEIFKEFKVYVADYAASSIETTAESVTINVNGALADADIGTLADGAYRFKTIQQALDFLNVLEFGENTKKVINLADGLYKEKLEINIPNLTIKGANTDASNTVIEWDSLYGIEDEGGFLHTTDSTATLNVREKAVGFVIENVTISNWFNSVEHFDEVFGPKYGEHRALAVLIQADKVVVDNCRMLGYQDTLELFTGRQVIKNSYINGRTDFIFGTNNTTYFQNCEIESIDSKGYITAFKGMNKNKDDAITYGAIFDGCEFTYKEGVEEGTTAIGRPWGAYAAVAVINSRLDKHISKAGYNGGTSGTRYVSMSGVAPTVETAKFFEYNNTGDGAITAEVAGMKFLMAETVKNYTDMSVIFGTTNGGVTYSTAWDGGKGVTITEKTYRFTADVIEEAALHETALEGETIFGGDMTVIAVDGAKWRAESSKNQAQFNAGCVIKMNVEGTVSVATYGGDYGKPENVSINYKNGFAVIKIKATAASPITNGCYVTSIMLNKAEEGVHTHEYSEWVVTPAESGDNYGTAVRTCDDCELETAHSQSVTLPALSTEDYTISASATSGMATYTYESEFGKISFEAPELEGQHVHSYGAWTVTATLEAAGTATKVCTSESCNNDDTKTVVVNIPALTDANYVVTDNTATLEAGGTGTYTITVDGVEVSFEAETPKLTLTRITEDYTYTYDQNVDLVSTDKILFTNCAKNGDWLKYGGAGSSITLNLPEGATLRFTRSGFEASAKILINGVEQTAGNGAEVEYLVTLSGYTVITATGTAYLKSISVEIDLAYEHRHTFGDWKITVAEEGENYGTAVRSCVVENCGVANETQTVTLPALSAEKYDIAPGATEGKSIFTLKEEPSISFEADSLAGVHVHSYSDWTVTEENMPTAEATGKATRTCSGGDGCGGLLELALPALTDSRYVITNNTATLTAAGTGTYTIELDGETVSFTAETSALTLNVIDKNVTISFGSSGNYKTAMSENNLVAEFTSGGNIRDNGGNNSQLSGTTLNIKVKAGAKVAVSSYNGYTNYDVKIDGVKLGETQTGTSWEYTAEKDCMISFMSTNNNNYFYNIAVSYGVKEITTDMTHSISADGIDGNEYFELNGVQNHQGSHWLFKNEATIKFKVAAGAKITLNCSYWGNNNYIVVNGVEKSGLTNNTPLVIEMAEGGEVVISILNDETHNQAVYLQSIEVSFAA